MVVEFYLRDNMADKKISGLTDGGDLRATDSLVVARGSSSVKVILDIKDEDNMVSDSTAAVATQQSIKAFVEAQTAAGVPDGDKGDITVTSTGTVWTINSDAVTFDKMQDTTSGDVVLGNASTSAGTITEITMTAAGRALMDDASAAAQRTTLGVIGSTTDNTIIRANGTAGITQGSGVVISDADEISDFNGKVVAKSSTAITLATADTGTIITTTSTAAASIITLPNSLVPGFNCSIIQNSTAGITFAAGSGATLNNRQSHTKIAGQFGVSTVIVTSNSSGSTAAVFVLAGDTST